MTKMEPPVPAQNAMSCQSSASIGTVSVEYLRKERNEGGEKGVDSVLMASGWVGNVLRGVDVSV